jgi:hypothetical protein
MQATRFQEIWSRLIDKCVALLPWEAMVDFKAHDWPVMNASKLPKQLGMRDYSELAGEVHTEMSVTLRGRKIELVYFPSSEMWFARGYQCAGLDWVQTKAWSPDVDGKAVRGQERLEALANVSMNWLTNGQGADYGRGTSRVSVCDTLASVDGQATGGGLPVGEREDVGHTG